MSKSDCDHEYEIYNERLTVDNKKFKFRGATVDKLKCKKCSHEINERLNIEGLLDGEAVERIETDE